jgi:hypothetical protein
MKFTRICTFERCAKEFQAKREDQRFCSVACARRSENEARKGSGLATMDCVGCGKPFVYPRKETTRKFCSSHCAVTFQWKTRTGEIPTHKVCRSCGASKELEEFHHLATGRYGYANVCKECERETRSPFRQLMTEGEVAAWVAKRLAEQQGVCAVCGRVLERGRGKNRMCIDHCHRTGRLRGLLCGPCNTALGMVNDDTSVLLRACAYLMRWEQATYDEPSAPKDEAEMRSA